MSTKVKIEAPADGAVVSSPLAIVRVHYEDAHMPTAILKVGEVIHVLELAGQNGEVRENVTLLEGKNKIEVTLGNVHHAITLELKPSKNITFATPGDKQSIGDRATGVTGSYKNVSCPAGVIAVNGWMQQFSVRGTEGSFDEKIVLQPGANHVAVQIGELYATRLVTGAFHPAKLLVTLVWDTPSTDVDLYVTEPNNATVFYGSKNHAGNLDVDRTQGFGPENYSIVSTVEGNYYVRVHYYADRGLGRTEWAIRVISDESSSRQRQSRFYGILDYSNSANAAAGSSGRDWNEVCKVHVAHNGDVQITEG